MKHLLCLELQTFVDETSDGTSWWDISSCWWDISSHHIESNLDILTELWELGVETSDGFPCTSEPGEWKPMWGYSGLYLTPSSHDEYGTHCSSLVWMSCKLDICTVQLPDIQTNTNHNLCCIFVFSWRESFIEPSNPWNCADYNYVVTTGLNAPVKPCILAGVSGENNFALAWVPKG